MPIYGFECTACGHTFDRLQKLSDADPSHCPVCAEASIRRQLTAPAFRLAGSGWYETDFKKEGDKKRNLAGGEESAAKPEAAKTDAATKSESGKSESASKNESAPTASKEAKPAPAASSAPAAS